MTLTVPIELGSVIKAGREVVGKSGCLLQRKDMLLNVWT